MIFQGISVSTKKSISLLTYKYLQRSDLHLWRPLWAMAIEPVFAIEGMIAHPQGRIQSSSDEGWSCKSRPLCPRVAWTLLVSLSREWQRLDPLLRTDSLPGSHSHGGSSPGSDWHFTQHPFLYIWCFSVTALSAQTIRKRQPFPERWSKRPCYGQESSP